MKTTWLTQCPLFDDCQECTEKKQSKKKQIRGVKANLAVIVSPMQRNQNQADRRTPADPDLDVPWIQNKAFAPFAFSLRAWRVHGTALYVTAAHPARTSAVNVPALSRFTHTSSSLNESANHPTQPTSKTKLYVSDGKIMLGYFRWRGATKSIHFIMPSPFSSEPRMRGLDS